MFTVTPMNSKGYNNGSWIVRKARKVEIEMQSELTFATKEEAEAKAFALNNR